MRMCEDLSVSSRSDHAECFLLVGLEYSILAYYIRHELLD